MKKISTHFNSPTLSSSNFSTQIVSGPKKQTLALLRQFARVYQPINALPGIVLN